MADKELRHMSRSELIEIIYAMEQQELGLRQEIEELQKKLDDRTVCIENSGSIAEASLSLSHIFEDAQEAADRYLISVEKANEEAGKIREDAEEDAEEILKKANEEKAAAEKMMEQAKQEREEISEYRKKFIDQAASILNRNPELRAEMYGSESRGTKR